VIPINQMVGNSIALSISWQKHSHPTHLSSKKEGKKEKEGRTIM
jgi:hypothetical protein